MKAKKKSFRKDLKQPDEFVTFWGRVFEFVMQHRLKFLLGLAGVVVVVLLIYAGVSHLKNREEKASDLLGKAQAVLRDTTVPAGVEGMTPEIPLPGPDTETKDKAVTLLEELVDEYGGTHAGQQARILLGDIYFKRGDFDSAVNVYKDFQEGKSEPSVLEALALEGLAYSLEAKGDVAEALVCYEKLSRSDLSHVQGWAWLGQARCHEKQEQLEKALEAYRKLLSDYPHHPKAKEAEANISRISGLIEISEVSSPAGPGPT